MRKQLPKDLSPCRRPKTAEAPARPQEPHVPEGKPPGGPPFLYLVCSDPLCSMNGTLLLAAVARSFERPFILKPLHGSQTDFHLYVLKAHGPAFVCNYVFPVSYCRRAGPASTFMTHYELRLHPWGAHPPRERSPPMPSPTLVVGQSRCPRAPRLQE